MYHDGITQQSFVHLCDQVNALKNEFSFRISCTMVQIYFSQIDDLLLQPENPIQQITIENDVYNLVHFKNATEIECKNLESDGP